VSTAKARGWRTQDARGLGQQGYAGGLYDPDTSLVRFGARDYDAREGRWLTKDPIQFDAGQASFYVYVGNDPVNAIDPSGLIVETAWDVANIGIGIASLIHNLRCGNRGAAVLDVLGIGVDSVAAAVPFLPGGVGAILKGVRAGDKALDGARAARGATIAPSAGAAERLIHFGSGVRAGAATSHSRIKPAILKAAGNFAGKVGKNPDIEVVRGSIRLIGQGPFKGKTLQTGLNASDFF
jgi:RHS repeat-associated protein